jgi:hypothetical protein
MRVLRAIRGWFARDWSDISTIFLVWLFLHQFSIWLRVEKVLQPVTADLIDYTLGLVLITEWMTFIPRSWRSFLQFVSIAAVHLLVLDYKPVAIRLDSVDAAVQSLYANFAPLAPYVVFGMGAWIVYTFMLWAVQAKWRIYTIMIISVLSFAIRDSFSKLILWEQAGTIMFCGLAILIVRHFISLREKNPNSWSHFADYPMSIAGPTAGLLVTVFALGILAPEFRPIITDPYTWWMNSKGQAVFTDGKGLIAAASGSSTLSGYSRNDESLGGEFNFDYTPVMNVDTTFRGYWRGEARSLYSGAGWEASEAERRAAVTPIAPDVSFQKDARVNAEELETREVRQTVTILDQSSSFPVLFAAAGLEKLIGMDNLVGPGDTPSRMLRLLRWAPAQQELRWDPRARNSYPEMYTVISQIPIIDEKAFRQAPADFPNKSQFSSELQLPESLPERVKALAAEVTQSANNPYDKAKLLETYLSSNYKYTNKPDLSKGRSRDFVDRFLFEVKEGYCDYYSSAFVVMARSLGIPARWVKGYSSGYTEDEEFMTGIPELDADPDRAGIYTVRNSDAHSWAEVYLEGYGWIPFEPTSGFSIPIALPEGELLTLPDLSELTALQEPVMEGRNWGAVSGWVGGALIVALAVFAFINRSRLVLFLRKRGLGRAAIASTNQRIVMEFERFLRYAGRKGFRREEYETAREMADRWMKDNSSLQADLEKLLRLFEKAKYSPATVTEEEFEQTVHIVKVLREQF